MSQKFNQQFACSRMMLPEHRAGLEHEISSMRRAEERRRPLIDEQRQEELQQVLEKALACGNRLVVTVAGNEGPLVRRGAALRTDQAGGTILFDIGESRPLAIRVADIVSLEEDLPP